MNGDCPQCGSNESGAHMTRILTIALSVYWAVLFSGQAAAIVGLHAGLKFNGGEAVLAAFTVPYILKDAGMIVNLVLGGTFALTATLFVWSAGLSAIGQMPGQRTDDITSKAIALGVLSTTIALVLGMSSASAALFQTIGLQIAGLAGTFAAIAGSRIVDTESYPESDRVVSARVLALNAAHSSMLARLSGRDHRGSGGTG